MLLPALCVALLSQAPSNEPIKVAVPPLKLVGGIDEKLADFYSGHLAQQLSFQGITTVTSTEMAAMLGLERQKQLLGCDSDSCKANVLGALGVDGIVVGTVTKLDRSYQFDVRIIAAGDGSALAGASANSEDNDRLVGTFTVVAEQLARQLGEKLNRVVKAAPGRELVQGASKVKRLAWVPLAVGGAAAITGAVFLGLSHSSYGQLTTPRVPPETPLSMSQTEAIASAGTTQQTVGWVCIGVGVAGVAAAAGMFLFGGNDTVQAGVAFSPQGATLSIAGALP